MNIGERIFEERKRKGLSQSELADLIGVSRQAVSKWESSTATPDLDKIVVLSKVFEISIDHLINGTDQDTKRTKKKIDPLIFTIIATAFDLFALIMVFNYFLYIPIVCVIPPSLIVIALALYTLGIVIGDKAKRKRAHRIFWSVNIWIILFIVLYIIFMKVCTNHGIIWYYMPSYPDIDLYIGSYSTYSRLYAEALARYDLAVSCFYTFWSIYIIGSALTIFLFNFDIIKRRSINKYQNDAPLS